MAPANRPAFAGSLSEKTETLVANAILSGALKPGCRLSLPMLAANFGIGATPLREGLSRLVARGLVTLSGNKGFKVADISQEDLLDITTSRIVIERAALAHAFSHGGEAWEDEVADATRRLLRVIRKSDALLLEGTAEYDEAHKRFHAALISGCGLDHLMTVQSNLYDAAYRYRRVMSDGLLQRDHVIHLHERLSALVLARDATAFDELERHLMMTIEVIYPRKHKND